MIADKVISEWFFLSFFGVIKSIPDKFFGFVLFVVIMAQFVIWSLLIVRVNDFTGL
jgi:hypothetical protein